VAPAQVAEWAGHSVEVLLRTYARCLDGQHDIAKRGIMDVLEDDLGRDEEPARSQEPGDGDQRDGTLSLDDAGREGDRLRDARHEHPPPLSRAQPRQ
jgi:hypothetical protein